ncbi:hypothetical protein MMC25_007999 [Agyrium rufum]|nr:hypothetical protein [Agyrium rufum]
MPRSPGVTDPSTFRSHSAASPRPYDPVRGERTQLPSLSSIFTSKPSPRGLSDLALLSHQEPPPRQPLPYGTPSIASSGPISYPIRYDNRLPDQEPQSPASSHAYSALESHSAPASSHLYSQLAEKDSDARVFSSKSQPASGAFPTHSRLPFNEPYPPPLLHQSSNPTRLISPNGSPGAQEHQFVRPKKPPRKVLHEEEVTGEGLCYVYEDGSRVKKIIDGESVNANWGVTKAGKPRKRLAVACLTCREKKIKCEPGEIKCAQCEKSGRECHFQTAPRGQASFDPSVMDSAVHTPSSFGSRTDSYFEEHVHSPSAEQEYFGRGPLHPPVRSSSVDSIESSGKRSRYLEHSVVVGSNTAKRPRHVRVSSSNIDSGLALSSVNSHTGNRDIADMSTTSSSFGWCNDPYNIDKALTRHCVEEYFIHVNPSTCSIFPEAPMMHWLEHEKQKSEDDLMMLHAMLAIGSVWSNRPDAKAEGRQFADIASYAIERKQGQFLLQLAQARLMLTFYYFASGDTPKAWDLCGSACRVTAGLKLNIEDKVIELSRQEPRYYGLSQEELAECLRRTYWSCFLLDRYNGYYVGQCLLDKEDSFVRLPSLRPYASGLPSIVPFLDSTAGDEDGKAPYHEDFDIMAYLVTTSMMWGDILANVHRSMHRPGAFQAKLATEFYPVMQRRLTSWISQLPPDLDFTPEIIKHHIETGRIGAYVSLYGLLCNSRMMLNRYAPKRTLTSDEFTIRVRSARDAAFIALRFMDVLLRAMVKPPPTAPTVPEGIVQSLEYLKVLTSSPTPGYAIAMAMDILTAGGALDQHEYNETLYYLKRGIDMMEQLGVVWSSSMRQGQRIQRRITRLQKKVRTCATPLPVAWMCPTPLESTFCLAQDVIYPKDQGEKLFHALGLQIRGESDVLSLEDDDARPSSPESE